MIESLIDKDVELFIFLNNLGSIQWDSFWLIITNKFSAIPLYLLLLYVTFKKFGVRKTIIVVLLIAILIALSDQTSNLFKYGFKRLRPCHNENINHLMRLVKDSCGGLYSYFSAHAANSMAIALFFGLLLRNFFRLLPYLLVFWALLVAYSRIYIGVHYPADVITGILIGALYGFVFYNLLMLFFRKFIK